MNPFKFIIRSTWYYRRQHLSLFLGMAISAAVLTGALIIGDSIQFSLEKLVENRLGKTKIAVIGGSRFMDTRLASKLEKCIHIPVSPVLMLRGIAINPESDTRINQTSIYGIDQTFGRLYNSLLTALAEDEAIINNNIANRLELKRGDDLVIRVQSAGIIPVNAPFSREPSPTMAIRLKIKAIVNEDQAGMFNLSNSQSGVFNVFVSLGFLGNKMDLKGLSNVLLIAEDNESFATTALDDSMQRVWSLKDLGLSVKMRPQTGTYDLISDRVFIDSVVSDVAVKAQLPFEEIITYLVNDIGTRSRHTPYSFASAVSPALSGTNLNENDVILNRWTADDLGVSKGDSVVLTYYRIGPLRKLYESDQKFRIKEIIANQSKADSSLMPKFQGLSEAGNCSDWNTGIPIDLKRIRDKDEKYWDDLRGTPKVLLSIEKGKGLWKNSFGMLTTMRFQEAQLSREMLTNTLLRNIQPSEIGFQIVDIRNDATMAAENSVNFTELFLGMSFFIIASGLLLTLLIYSLHFNRRSFETSLLSGLGLSRNRIVLLRILETGMVIVTGSLFGALLGILYNYALLAGINSIWHDMVRTDMLMVHVTARSLLTGTFFSMLIAIIPLYFVTVRKLRQPIARMIKSQSDLNPVSPGIRPKGYYRGFAFMVLSFLLILVSLFLKQTENAALYLTSAACFLIGGILLFNSLLKYKSSDSFNSVPGILHVAFSNMKRNRGRNLAVVALLATGTFTVILTGAYRKTYYGTENIRKSGTGGYSLWAETMSPVLFDLNSAEERDRLITEDSNQLKGVRCLQFEQLEGDDASCLNLNQAQHPKILAINPDEFDSRGAFSFTKMVNGVSSEHPWQQLESSGNGNTFPAFVDQTVLQYSLKKKLGDTLRYINESGKTIGFVLTGSLDNSIFQGNILISDKVFRKQFPSSGGSKIMLIDVPKDKEKSISEILNRSLTDYGIDIMSTRDRLATFNSVENTYLSVFMALSGLGFIIGTIGLGIVLLQNIHERRQELALMISLGFGRKRIFRIVFLENIFLLIAGITLGWISALVGIMPSLISPVFHFQGSSVLLLTAGILVSGFLWIYFPLKSVLQKPLLRSLRND